MPSFTTRVELHNATSTDYDNLHAAMQQLGFHRFIKSDDGTWYHLPPAEYDYSGDLTGQNLRDMAEAAIHHIGKTGMILVTESAGRFWNGLPQA